MLRVRHDGAPGLGRYTRPVFRSDRDALAGEVEELRREREALRAENERLRSGVLARRAPARAFPTQVYTTGPVALGDDERIALMRTEVEAMPIWQALLLHFMTFGLFSFVQYNLLHGKLPQIQKDDPTPAKAIGFSFIPYFNLYWVVWNTLRITDRVNFQFALRGLPDAVPRRLMIACAVVNVIPYVNVLLGVPLLWPFAVYYLQRATNQLAALRRDEMHPPERADAWQAPPVRVAVDNVETSAPELAEVQAAEDELAEQEAEAAAVKKA
jgi:hypothetical protein